MDADHIPGAVVIDWKDIPDSVKRAAEDSQDTPAFWARYYAEHVRALELTEPSHVVPPWQVFWFGFCCGLFAAAIVWAFFG